LDSNFGKDDSPLKTASISEASVCDLRDFETKVKAHLGIYKRNNLKIEENGLYKRNKLPYEHILPEDKWKANLMEPYRAHFLTAPIKITYHTDFHHLNSSQAMCINFFYPLIKENKLDLLLRILGVLGEVDYGCFEKQSELEVNADRRTNFDFYIKLKSGDQVYFEIKYTEKSFGKAKKDKEHKNKFNDVYKPLLDSNKAINEQCKTEDYFLDNYQIMRNLVHINDESRVVFIYPEDNLSIRKTALAARSEIIADGWERHIILYTWENLIKQLTCQMKSQELIDYYHEFEKKYLKY
jgi:hypothetical protein